MTPVLDDAHRLTSAAVETAYRRLAPVYDLVYGVGLEHGRRMAIKRLAPRSGEVILEVGVGTGLSSRHYPSGCHVAAIDLSEPMLVRARARLDRRGVGHVSLVRMDAANLAFPDGCFDAVYAPYVLNVVPDPLRVVREMMRVCRRGGRVVILNHFAPQGGTHPAARLAWNVAARVGGISWQLELSGFLQATGLTADSVDDVNFRVSSVVVCHNTSTLHGAQR